MGFKHVVMWKLGDLCSVLYTQLTSISASRYLMANIFTDSLSNRPGFHFARISTISTRGEIVLQRDPVQYGGTENPIVRTP